MDSGKTKNQCKILIVAVGGAGCNAAKTMKEKGLNDVSILSTNTDQQSLYDSKADYKILLGENSITRGLGAGSDPAVGAQAAQESLEEFLKYLDDVDMVFFTGGMGGGTGTGAINVLAQAAKEMGKLVVAVVTKPFVFEGKRRSNVAEQGIKELINNVDTLIVVPNENLFKVSGTKTPFLDAFKEADEVLYQTVSGITDLITQTGLINLDFADVRSVMKDKGLSMVGFGNNMNNFISKKLDKDSIQSSDPIASHVSSVEDTITAAMHHPLLEDNLDISTAKAILLNITGGANLTLSDVDIISKKVHQKFINDEVHILIGATINTGEKKDDASDKKVKTMADDEIHILIVATGIDQQKKPTRDSMSSKMNDPFDKYSSYTNDGKNDNKNIDDLFEEMQNKEAVKNLVNNDKKSSQKQKNKSFLGRLFGVKDKNK